MGRALFVALAFLVGIPAIADPVADASAAFKAGELEKAAALLDDAARNGDPRAQYNLALLYDERRSRDMREPRSSSAPAARSAKG
jgi:TPR repeat protein